MEGKLISVANAAKRLYCTKQTIYERIYKGDLDKISTTEKRGWMVTVESIERFRIKKLQEADYEFEE